MLQLFGLGVGKLGREVDLTDISNILMRLYSRWSHTFVRGTVKGERTTETNCNMGKFSEVLGNCF